MRADTASVAAPEPAGLDSGLAARQLRYFKAQIEDWFDACRRLGAWEEQHLLDAPGPERLAEHARLLDELDHVGRWFDRVTQDPDHPDRSSAELVAMTVQDLRDRRARWHGQMSKDQREAVLRAIFDES